MNYSKFSVSHNNKFKEQCFKYKMGFLGLPQNQNTPHVRINLMPDEVLQYKLGRPQMQGQTV